MVRNFILLIGLLTISYSAASQTQSNIEVKKRANALFLEKSWKEAIPLYELITTQEKDNWRAKVRLGQLYLSTDKVEEACRILEQAVELGDGSAKFALGRAYLFIGDTTQAFSLLSKSIEEGYSLLSTFENDTIVQLMRSHSLYDKLHSQLLDKVYPCKGQPAFRQFDFWVGEWSVKSAAGFPVGTSKIERILGDCVILENWTSLSGNDYSGKSINTYDSEMGYWKQTWVDDKGSIIEFKHGIYLDGKLVYTTDPKQNGSMNKLSFFNLGDDSVRQFSEISKDSGHSWEVEYDFYYTRIK